MTLSKEQLQSASSLPPTPAPRPAVSRVLPGTSPVAVGKEVGANYLGCFHDNQKDRVLGDYLHKPDMTTKVSSAESRRLSCVRVFRC